MRHAIHDDSLIPGLHIEHLSNTPLEKAPTTRASHVNRFALLWYYERSGCGTVTCSTCWLWYQRALYVWSRCPATYLSPSGRLGPQLPPNQNRCLPPDIIRNCPRTRVRLNWLGPRPPQLPDLLWKHAARGLGGWRQRAIVSTFGRVDAHNSQWKQALLWMLM